MAAPEVEPYLARMEEAVADGYADLTLSMGGSDESSTARLWQGQVLVDWERDEVAGGCLLRPPLVRKLLALHAAVAAQPDGLGVTAAPRVVAALSPRHAGLALQLGEPPELRLVLRFDGPMGAYRGGEETYLVRSGGRVATVLLRLTARVRPRPTPGASERTPRERS